MVATPEGKVKRKVSEVLRATPDLYYFMPVPSGFGESSLDYLGCYRGLFFSVETKKPGGKLTARQESTRSRMQASGGKVFVIDGDITELVEWLDAVCNEGKKVGVVREN